MVCATPMSKCHPIRTGLHQQFFYTASYFSPWSRGIHWHWRRHKNPCHQHYPWLLLSLTPDPQRTSLAVASRLDDSRSSLGGQQGWLLQCCSCRDSRIPAKAVTVTIECGGSADLLGEEVRPHNATTPGTALAACPRTYPSVPAMRVGLPLSDWHSATVPGWHSKPVYQRCCSLSALCW